MSNRWSQVLALKPLNDYPKQTFELALPHGKMLNHIQTSTKNPQLKVRVDGYKAIVTYSANHHHKPLDDLEKLAIYGNLVNKQDHLHTVIPYDEDIDIQKFLHMSFKSLYRKYKNGQLDLEPAYQRAFVWTPEQQEAYILGLFRETATIEPTLVQYYKDGSPDEIYEVLDGKQRLTTLINFVEGKTKVKGLTFDQITNYDMQLPLKSFLLKTGQDIFKVRAGLDKRVHITTDQPSIIKDMTNWYYDKLMEKSLMSFLNDPNYGLSVLNNITKRVTYVIRQES